MDLPVVHSTFRAWTMISNYLRNQENKPATNDDGKFLFDRNLIEGLIGKTQGIDFINYLTSNYNWAQLELGADQDEFDYLLESSLENNLPFNVIGASGIGKTARVMNYARDRNYAVELIPLSTKTRNDIM